MMIEMIDQKETLKKTMKGIHTAQQKNNKLEINTIIPKFTFKSKNGNEIKPVLKVSF